MLTGEYILNIGIYIYDNAEVLDFSGPFEVFSTANRFLPEFEEWNVLLIGETLKPVMARGGYSVNPNVDFNSCPKLDVLIVVGGIHDNEIKKEDVITWIDIQADKVDILASVCTGAFLIAKTGRLDHHHVTTHWQDIDGLQRMFPLLQVKANARWIDEGSIITSAGISAGIDMSLYLVSKLKGIKVAENTAVQMEYDWPL